MGTPDDVLPGAITYVRIYFGGSFGIVMYNIFVGILRASGDSRHPLYYLVASSLVNIVLDWIFVAFFGMGIAGAALATVISELVSVGLALHRLLHIDASYRVDLRKIMLDADNAGTIIRYGIPSAIQGCVVDFSNILIQSYVNSFGMAAIAGIGAYSRVEGFIFLPVTAFSLALSTFVSQNMGAREKERIRKGMRFGLGCTAGLLLVMGAAMYALAPQLIALFNREPEIIRYGLTRTRICALFYFLVGFSHTASAVARGLGRPMTPMVVMLTCWCAVRVLTLATVGRVWHDIRLVCWIYPFTWFLSSAVYVVYLRSISKKMLK
jgi:putative MATE family efflux protein